MSRSGRTAGCSSVFRSKLFFRMLPILMFYPTRLQASKTSREARITGEFSRLFCLLLSSFFAQLSTLREDHLSLLDFPLVLCSDIYSCYISKKKKKREMCTYIYIYFFCSYIYFLTILSNRRFICKLIRDKLVETKVSAEMHAIVHLLQLYFLQSKRISWREKE